MKQGYTHVLVIVDRSGSMSVIKEDTQGGLNTYVADQAAQPGECRITLVEFDTKIDTVHQDVAAADMPSYVLHPRGGTALYDAIGQSCSELGAALAAKPEEERPAHVVVVILTDGHENSSREYTLPVVKEMVERQTAEWNWEFTFLGANQDAVLTGQGLGIAFERSLTYAATPDGVANTFAVASASTSMLRSGGGFHYSQADRDAAMGGDTDSTGK